MSKNVDGSINMQDIAPAQTTEWYTPEKILIPVRSYFGGQIPLDPATTKKNNTKAKKIFTLKENGLEQEWSKKGTFLNPPYSRVFHLWLAKVHEQAAKGRTIIGLFPMGSRYSTKYYQRDALNEWMNAGCWIDERVKFLDENGEIRYKRDEETGEFLLDEKGRKIKGGNPYDSQLTGYNVDPERFAVHFGELGKVYRMEALA